MIPQKMIERFNSKWKLVENGCHEWIAGKHDRGYGQFHTSEEYSKRKTDYAHRVSYHINTGHQPSARECVCHSCDNPSCVNPKHLFLGTHTDNMRDMQSKGRSNVAYKWTSALKEQMRDLREFGYEVKEIASLYSVDRGHCSRICRGLA